MKLFAIILASISLLAMSSVVPSYANCTVVGGTGDHPNHQSSLSSTTEGGSVGYKTCTEN